MSKAINPDAALAQAAYDGHIATVRRALAHGTDPDALLRNDTALWWAAQEGHAEIVSVLLDAGANIHFAHPDVGFTPLYQAVSGGHRVATEVLLQRGADVNRSYPAIREGSVLHIAAAYGHLPCIKLLLAYGAEPDARNSDGQTPCDTAVECGGKEAAALLHRAAEELPA